MPDQTGNLLFFCAANRGGDEMTDLPEKPVKALVRRPAGLVVAALIFPLLSLGPWSSAWGQQSPREIRPPMQLQTDQRTPPAAVEPAPPAPTPAVLPVTDPNLPLGERLAKCDQTAGNSEALALPGPKGEVKLDRCFRGRDHLVCGFNALLTEAKVLLQNYKGIVDADYPNVGDVEGICRIKPDRLTADLQSAIEFTARFKALKAEYEARGNCATRVQQSFRDVAFPDLTQGPSVLKSMTEAIAGDLKGLSAVQAQVVELAERTEWSHRAIGTLQKLHRSMCATKQRAATDAEERASR
jgi:hypothetical protein